MWWIGFQFGLGVLMALLLTGAAVGAVIGMSEVRRLKRWPRA